MFDHFVGLALKGLRVASLQRSFSPPFFIPLFLTPLFVGNTQLSLFPVINVSEDSACVGP